MTAWMLRPARPVYTRMSEEIQPAAVDCLDATGRDIAPISPGHAPNHLVLTQA